MVRSDVQALLRSLEIYWYIGNWYWKSKSSLVESIWCCGPGESSIGRVSPYSGEHLVLVERIGEYFKRSPLDVEELKKSEDCVVLVLGER